MICLVLGFTNRQCFYKAKRREEKQKKVGLAVVKLVQKVRQGMERTGTRKLYPDLVPLLKEAGIKMGRDKVHAVLKEHDQLIKPSKNYKVTTDSRHQFRKHKNELQPLLDNDLLVKPEQVFVCDITYIRIGKHFAYLFLITDAYSRKIMGWTINFTMKVKDAKKAVKMACKNRIYKYEVIHHSDRGIQYCTPSYINYIKSKGMLPSMTQDDHVYENSIAERVNGILKTEFGLAKGFATLKEARNVILQAIQIYNGKRRHYSLELLTPNFVHQHGGIKMKRWGKKGNKDCSTKAAT